MSTQEVKENFSIIQLNTPYTPEKFSMTGDGIKHPLLSEIWELILSYSTPLKLEIFKQVSKSWYKLTIKVINDNQKECARILSIYHEKIYLKWKGFESAQKKPVHWTKVLKRERKIDQNILQNKTKTYPCRIVNIPFFDRLYSESNLFVFQGRLVVCGSQDENTISFYSLCSGKDFSKKMEQEIVSIQKLTNKSFAVLEQKEDHFCSIKLFELTANDVPKLAKRHPVNQSLEIPPFIKGREVVLTHYSLKENLYICLNLTFLSFDWAHKASYLQITLKKQIAGFNQLDHFIEDLTDHYIVILSGDSIDEEKFAFSSIFCRTDGSLILETPCLFKALLEHRALFWNQVEGEIMMADLTQSAPQLVAITSLNECLGLYLTPNTFYFVDETHLHNYDVKEGKVSSYPLLRPSSDVNILKKILGCKFIRVTERLLMFSLTIGIYDKKRQQTEKKLKHVYEEIFAYDVSEMKHAGVLKKVRRYSRADGMVFFDHNWVVDIQRKEAHHDDTNPHLLKSYEYGLQFLEKDTQLSQTMSLYFDLTKGCVEEFK